MISESENSLRNEFFHEHNGMKCYEGHINDGDIVVWKDEYVKWLEQKVISKNHTIQMPRRLTAENGAKGLLIGEFHETAFVPNPDYCEIENPDQEELIPVKIPISWSTIKDIYSKIVDHFNPNCFEK